MPLTKTQIKQIYKGPDASFGDFLPFKEYNEEYEALLFHDGKSVGLMLELSMINAQGKTEETLEGYAGLLQKMLNTIPQETKNPWIMQVFLQDEPVQALIPALKRHVDPKIKDHPHAISFIQLLDAHLRQASQPQGLFRDVFAETEWRTQIRKVRVCLYRNFGEAQNWFKGKGTKRSPVEILSTTRKNIISAFSSVSIKATVMDDKAIEAWLLPWFAPHPIGCDDGYDLLNQLNHSKDKPYGYDLARRVLVAPPLNDVTDENNFIFTGQLQRFISCQPIQFKPRAGRVTADLKDSTQSTFCVWDKMPYGSILAMTIVFDNQNMIRSQVERIAENGKGLSSEQATRKEQAVEAKHNLGNGERLYSFFVGTYIRASNHTTLDDRLISALAQMRSMGLEPIEPSYDLLAKDLFVRMLPMAYNEAFDNDIARRSAWTYSLDIARLLPLYGRSVGTGHPGIILYNRAGEPYTVDVLKDRSRVGHGLIFGPTGAGKSVFLNYDILFKMAIYKCRLFVIEKGDSMRWTAMYLQDKGFSVNRIKYSKSELKPIPIFANYKKAYEEIKSRESIGKIKTQKTLDESNPLQPSEDDERDFTGEIMQLVFLMVSGASEAEQKRLLTRENQLALYLAVEVALIKCVESGKDYFLPQDIAESLADKAEAEHSEKRKEILHAMSDAMSLWTKELRGQLFNQPGEPWEVADATFIDMGMLTSEVYKDALAVMVIGLLHQITGLGEACRFDGEHTFVYIDEGHVITTNPTIAEPVVFGAKTWRKLWIWLIQATQNMEDYPEKSAKMISMAEWYWLINLADGEVSDFNRFVKLPTETNELITTARKERGKYTEGVLINRDQGMADMFRVVLPVLPLVLSGTEGDELKAISDRCESKNIPPIEAIYQIADEMVEERGIV